MGNRVGRPEKVLRPEDGPLQRFAYELRQLRDRDGDRLSYREIAALTRYSISTLTQATRGERLPTLEVTLAYVTACHGDTEVWRRRWYQLAGNGSAEAVRQLGDGSAEPGVIRPVS
jgi:transcriptional regulator with XRE-family HTH domain